MPSFDTPRFVEDPLYRGDRGGEVAYYMQNVITSQKPIRRNPGVGVIAKPPRLTDGCLSEVIREWLEVEAKKQAELDKLEKNLVFVSFRTGVTIPT